MKGSELVRKVKALGAERAADVSLVPQRGKGSHQTLYFGEKWAILPNPKKKLKKGTLHAILRQLGIDPSELK